MTNSLVEFRNEAKRITLEGDFITSDRFQRFSREHPKFIYVKRDFLFRRGNWRGSQINALWLRSDLTGKTLIAGHSDLSLQPRAAFILRMRGLSRIWGTNVVPWSSYASPIPLGLTNNCGDSPLHRIYGDHSLLHEAVTALQPPLQYSRSIYVNFTMATAKRERTQALEAIRSYSNVSVEEPDPTRDGRLAYLRSIRQHDFVLAPAGNGIDTHRFWEALYLGSIPIARKTSVMRVLAENLPCVLVDHWRQLEEPGFLDACYESLTHASLNPYRLQFKYWKDCISQNNDSTS